MTNDQITALAREYAEGIYRNAHKEMEVLPDCLSNESINMFAEDMESKLKWLLRRYYLVEKGTVRKEYHEIQLALGDGGRSEWEDDINMGKEVLLESLFPEIAKEVQK